MADSEKRLCIYVCAHFIREAGFDESRCHNRPLIAQMPGADLHKNLNDTR
jgi:hypothetical protein